MVFEDQSDNGNNKKVVRIQVASDLHIEFKSADVETVIIPQAPTLALLGDIGNACTKDLRDFLLLQSDRFERVIFVPGNHEYYNVGRAQILVDEQRRWMQSVCSERDNLYFMEKDFMVIDDDVVILATTLWSEIPDDKFRTTKRQMADYELSYIQPVRKGRPPRKMTPLYTCEEHRECVAWLEKSLQNIRNNTKYSKVVVLTHHTPLMTGTSHPRFEGGSLTCCFSSDLRHLLHSPISAWACGHTHYNFDMNVQGVRVVSNQRGYDKDSKRGYNSEFVLEI